MKRTMKKMTAVLMTVAMAIGMLATTAFAAEEENGAFPETGTLVIHKYLMDDLDDADNPNNGKETTVPAGATPLNGIEFNLYKVTPGTDGKLPAPGEYTVNIATGVLTDTEGDTFDFVAASPASVTTEGGTTENPDGIATAKDLPSGYYLVVEQEDSRVASPAAPFIVSVPMANPDGEGWLTTVHVYPKNESMSVEKTVNIPSVNVGDTVTWEINVSVPHDIELAKKYDIIDILDPALDYVANSVSVVGLSSKTATTASGTVIDATGNYVVTDVPDGDSTKLKVSFTKEGLEAIADGEYKFIRVIFETKVNQKINENGTVENTAQVDFTNRYDQDKEIDTNTETEISTGTVAILKTDASNGDVLKGAKFKIATSRANAEAGEFIRINAKKEILYKGDTGYDTADDWEVETDDDGKASFHGLKEYTQAAGGAKTFITYWLIETQAPSGFNMLSAPVSVQFTETSITAAAEHTVTSPIKNSQGFTLPVTGGMGTILFYVGGIVLIGLAVILVITSRKKKAA